MNTYKRHRFPPDIISYAVWLCYRFNLSHRDIEDLLAERGITVSREAIRLWYPKHSLRSWGRLCIKFGAIYTRRLKRKHRGYGDTFFIDEVFAGVPDHSNQRQAALSMALLTVNSYPRRRTAPNSTRIIVQNSRMNRPGSESGGCVSSSQLGRHSDSWVLMQRFQICLISAVI